MPAKVQSASSKNVPVVFAVEEDQKLVKVFLVSSRMERDEDRLWPHTRSVADAKNARQKIVFALKQERAVLVFVMLPKN